MAYDGEDKSAVSKLDSAAQLRMFKSWFKADSGHSANWRKEAKEDFDFVAGHGQWTQEERSALEQSERVPITFNMTLRFIKAVAGTEINGRHEVRYIPRTSEDTKPNELLTAASMWMSDGCDAEDEESEAFQNAMICGMGWTENRMDYESEPDGMYIEESINPLEMFWDGKARKKNLVDARRAWRIRKMLLSEARNLFPGVDDDDLDARWALGAETDTDKTDEERRRRKDENSDGEDDSEVVIAQVQWWEREPYALVADPATGQKVPMEIEQYETLMQRAKLLGEQISGVKMIRRVYKQAWLGNEILGEIEPAPCKDHFSWSCITGEPDKNKGTWFGLARVARDPQKWGNKWLTQSLHILNASAKGGIIAEKDAFEDQKQAESSWAKHDRITWANKGAISGPNGAKWAQKPATQFPAGFFQLMNFAYDAVPQVLGINMELMGMRDVNQPGVLEAQRKQAAMTILATMFDSLRRFRKIVGRIRLYFIQEYLSDGRLIRVVGQEGAEAIPLMREQTLGKYDVIVDDAPTSPNQKEANWIIISQMLPAFKDQLMQNPELLLATLEQSPLPSGFVDKLKAVFEKPDPEGEERAQIEKAGVIAVIDKDKASAEETRAKAAKVMSEIGFNPQDPQQQMLKVQEMLAGIQKTLADIAKTKAETAQVELETALKPAELMLEQEDNQRQHEESQRQANMNFAQKREAARSKQTAGVQ